MWASPRVDPLEGITVLRLVAMVIILSNRVHDFGNLIKALEPTHDGIIDSLKPFLREPLIRMFQQSQNQFIHT